MGTGAEREPDQLTLADVGNIVAPESIGIAVGPSKSVVLDQLAQILRVDDFEGCPSEIVRHSSPSELSGGYLVHRLDREEAWNDAWSVITSNNIDSVILTDVSVFGSDPNEIRDRFRELFDEDLTILLIDDLVRIDPSTDHVDTMLRTLDLLDSAGIGIKRATERRDIQNHIESIDYSGGRPPFGFEVESGELKPAEGFDEICSVLSLVDEGELSYRKAADRLDCSERTIQRAIEDPDRREWYGLSVDE